MSVALRSRYARFGVQLLVLTLTVGCLRAPVAADPNCTLAVSQGITQKGYAFLSKRNWEDARAQAGQLYKYVRDCSDANVQTPGLVHAIYIGAFALHHEGRDAEAQKPVAFGIQILTTYHDEIQRGVHMVVPDEASYKAMVEELYRVMLPKYLALQAHLRT